MPAAPVANRRVLALPLPARLHLLHRGRPAPHRRVLARPLQSLEHRGCHQGAGPVHDAGLLRAGDEAATRHAQEALRQAAQPARAGRAGCCARVRANNLHKRLNSLTWIETAVQKKASGGEMRRLPAIVLAGALLATPAAAQSEADYPGKPVKIIVNVAPGGGVDTATRIVAERLRARLGQPFVVENRPGAGGNIGAETVFHADGDGYTLLASSPTPLAINGWLYKKLAFEPAGFEPVALMSRIPNVLVVRRDFPAKSVRELVAVAKASPGKLTYGSQGIGTASHLTSELFMALTGTKLVHVPYKGSTSGVLTDVIAGHLDLSFIQFSAVHELQQNGKLAVLAVATDRRLEVLPDVPTMAEAGFPEVVSETWNAISAPPRTPAPIVLKLNAAINAALQEPEVLARLRDLQVLVGGGDTEETRRFVAEQRALWGKVIKAAAVPQQ